MFYNCTEVARVCDEFNITQDQLFILYATYTRNFDALFKYSEKGRGFDINVTQNLVEKGYLEPCVFKGEVTFLDLLVTPSFAEQIFIETFKAGDELYNAFPGFIEIDGKKVIATKGGEYNGKHYNKNMLSKMYVEAIGNNLKEHRKIIKAVEFGKEHNLINFVIRNFIMDELWIPLIKEREAILEKNQTNSIDV